MKPGKIGWNELVTSDPAAAIKFYTGLFGWETEKFPMPGKDYTMWKHDGKAFGGVMATPQPGAPTQWTNYVIVEDLEATLAKSTSLGGKTCMGPMDIPDVGRIAVLQDPQGGVIGLHQCT
ncbi:MAG: uncharacterized protein QOE70_807 [Chthoniobacter sp.]|nr:uncharacterized protein [Chthoniobacter sp.]